MVIALDAMGGDSAPESILGGALRAARRLRGEIALVGPAERLAALLPPEHARPANLRVVDAPQVIEMDEDPARGARNKPNSSLTVSVNLVRDGEADAVVSAGNSGAFMFLSQVRLRNLAGVQRAAIAAPLPGIGGHRLLIDAGANMDCRPIHLAQFGLMGSIYAQYAMGRKDPKVGLLSIGHEAGKGDELTKAAHELLKVAPINFIGNIEGNEIFSEKVDVIVADGFAGNVTLKVTEGVAQFLGRLIKQELGSSLWTKLGGLLSRPALRRAAAHGDYAAYGGALLLGVRGVCVVCHGRSNERAIENALLVAERAASTGVCERMTEGLEKLAAAIGPIEDMQATGA